MESPSSALAKGARPLATPHDGEHEASDFHGVPNA